MKKWEASTLQKPQDIKLEVCN